MFISGMNGTRSVAGLAAGVLCLLACAGPGQGADQAKIEYNRDVRPILANSCFACHGPDISKRKAKLGLDTAEAAYKALKDGDGFAIVPGKPDASALMHRVLTKDEDERMPPSDSGKTITAAQIEVLRRWISQGAEYQAHWGYLPPKATPAPTPKDQAWARTDIDRFILHRLEQEGLKPTPEADRATLIRRLSFDLIGLPPGIAEVDAFIADQHPAAYERLVDRLLASPHYGERMALHWLDLVRHADTIGYHSDNPRNVAPFRDYVIAAFNDNLPFDRFTIEQLAGDLLPEPTIAQRVASGYNRLLMTTEEGGAQAKEYEAKNAGDRVRNASTVWLGATLGCAECHDHKFDPYSAKDFYRFAAFFADVQEAAIGPREPGMPVPTAAQVVELARLDGELAAARAALAAPAPQLAAEQAAWEQAHAGYAPPVWSAWQAIGPFSASSLAEAYRTAFPPEQGVDLAATYEGGKLAWTAHPEWADGAIHKLTGDNSATYLYRTIDATVGGSAQLSLGSDDTISVWLNGVQLLAKEIQRGVAPDQEALTIQLKPGRNQLLLKIANGSGGYGFYFKSGSAFAPDAILAIMKLPADQRSAEQAAALAAHYRTVAPSLEPLRAALRTLETAKIELEKAMPRMLVASAGAPRTVRLLARGDWQDEKGEVVTPAVPHFLPQLAVTGRATRLDLARWLVADDNPVTARVFVNRLWKLFYGIGISRNLDDLGTQGEWPVHPELLDWLALRFRAGWDVKRLVKELVMSSAYRQGSSAPAARERDPFNRLVARQSAFRLDAELVRDTALAISGLLVPTIGGPSVKPYQPAGYWSHLNFPVREWENDKGPDAWRRGLYTFRQRTFPHPSLLAFDAPSREECVAERVRSNTPLQALALLNDPTYVEAARVFAERIIGEGGSGQAARIAWAYRLALSRAPTAAESALLADLLASQLKAYTDDRAAAAQVLAVGQRPAPAGIDAAELAAWTAVARVILNLHETFTRS